MAISGKWDKYITYAGKTLPPEIHQKTKTPGTEMFYVHDKIVPGAFTMCATWMTSVIPGAPEKDAPQHMHASPEFIGLCSGDPHDPMNLGAEAEFWYEDDKFIFTKSVLLFIPAMVRHAPLVILRLDRPIFLFHSIASSNNAEIEIPDSKFSRFQTPVSSKVSRSKKA